MTSGQEDMEHLDTHENCAAQNCSAQFNAAQNSVPQNSAAQENSVAQNSAAQGCYICQSTLYMVLGRKEVMSVVWLHLLMILKYRLLLKMARRKGRNRRARERRERSTREGKTELRG